MILDGFTAERIGGPWLRAALAPAGPLGRRAEDAGAPFGPGDEDAARGYLAEIVELASALDRDGVLRLRGALRAVPDPLAIVARARLGDPLGDVDFFELGRFADALEATARAWDAAGGGARRRPPVLSGLAALLAPGRDGATFYLAEAFATSLERARAAFVAAHARVDAARERLAQAVAAQLGFVPSDDEFIVMRDVVGGSLPRGVRVLRETPAYRACTLDLDPAALQAAAERDAALAALAVEEERARRTLAEGVARESAAVTAAAEALGELDRTLARVAFTQRWGGCVPAIAAGTLAFTDATYAPLHEALAAQGLPYTPLSLELRGAAVLTGPNMGGKSAALATCGFLALCVAYGVPPPAAAASLPVFAEVAWIGGGDADRARLLSAFATEVVRARDVLASQMQPQLVLVDEFARTTGPREGRALLVALVEAIARRGAFGFVATHFDAVARDAGVAHLAITGLRGAALDGIARDLHAALDAVAAAMDYRIVAVAGERRSESDALAVAGLLGLDRALVERARSLFAEEP